MTPPIQPETLSLTVAHASSGDSLHEMLAAVLQFPGYYGKNWDAFRDCIRDPDQSVMPRRLIIKGIDILEDRLPREAKHLRLCLADVQRETSTFEVTFEPGDHAGSPAPE